MRLLGNDFIEEFINDHPEAEKALKRWVKLIKEGSFKHFEEIKRVFGGADRVGSRTVFNVGGNKFRTITVITYEVKTVKITQVLTHREYDLGKWKD